MTLTPIRIAAQQGPVHGCNAAPSCRPLGSASLVTSPGVSGVFFGVGMNFTPGTTIYLVSPRDAASLVGRPAPSLNRELFHLNVSLLPPTPVPTPQAAPRPSPTPTPSRSNTAQESTGVQPALAARRVSAK